MIGGKNQLTTLNALMAGLNATNSDGENEYEALRAELNNCNGALDKMANTMTDNYNGALARAQSALDDFKISIGQKLEPYLTKFLNWFAEKLPRATEKFSIWIDSKLPKGIEFCKKAFQKIKPVIEIVIKNFSKLVSIGIGVIAGLKAFTIITKVVTLYNALKKATSLAKLAQLAFNTSLLACPITWIAVAIGALAGGFLLYKNSVEKAKKLDIAKHFGDIALSADDCSKVVRNVFDSDLIEKVNELNSAWKESESSIDSLSESARKLNKLTFQMELNPLNVSKDEYLEATKGYVDNLQEAIKNKQFEVALDINFILGKDSELAKAFTTQSNDYWSEVLENAKQIGNDLSKNIELGFDKGWNDTITTKVNEDINKLRGIQEKIQKAQGQSQMELLTEDFKMGDLSQESFDTYLNKLIEQSNAIAEANDKAIINAMAQKKLELEDGKLNKNQYNSEIEALKKAYNKQKGEALSRTLTEATRAIKEVFGEEYEEVAKTVNEELSKIDFTSIEPSKMAETLQQSIEETVSKSNISEGAKEKLSGYLESLIPTANELKTIVNQNGDLSKEFSDAIISFETLNLLADKGGEMGKAIMKGVGSEKVLSSAEKTGKEIKNRLLKAFDETATVKVPLKINYTFVGDDTFNGSAVDVTNPLNTKPYIQGPTKANATGTNYFGGGWTRINENGGEIINLPTGSQIIPADKSEKMVKGNKSINVSVNVQGNIFGLENAAEIIGNMVCEKLYDGINAI